mgnify:CR=1 FL=1
MLEHDAPERASFAPVAAAALKAKSYAAWSKQLAASLSATRKLELLRSLREIAGLDLGFSHGRGGSMHLQWHEAGAIGTNAIVGGGATGVELADGSIYQRDAGLAQQLFKRDAEIDDLLLEAMERWETLSAR